MRGLKKEIGIILIGAMLIFCSSLSIKDDNKNLKDDKNSIAKNNDSYIEEDSKNEKNLNSRTPSSKNEDNENEKDIDGDTNNNSLRKPKGIVIIDKKVICLDSESCNYTNNDPLGYSLEVYKDISRDINTFSNDWLKNWDQFSKSDQNHLTELLKLESGFIKKELLSFLNQLPTNESKDYYSLVVDEVLNYHDANLMDNAVEFLKKIKDETNEERIAQDFTKTIKNGSPHVAQAISKHSLAFISPKTRPYFADLKKSLPGNSPETVQVEAAMIEHDMLVSGG